MYVWDPCAHARARAHRPLVLVRMRPNYGLTSIPKISYIREGLDSHCPLYGHTRRPSPCVVSKNICTPILQYGMQ